MHIENVQATKRQFLQLGAASLAAVGLSGIGRAEETKDLLDGDSTAKKSTKPNQVQTEINKIKDSKNTGAGSGIKKTMIPSESSTLGEWTIDVIPQGGSNKVRIFVYALNENGEIKKGEKGLLGYQGEIEVSKLTTELKNIEINLKLSGYVEKDARPILWIEGTAEPKQESSHSLFKITSDGSTWGENTSKDLQDAVVKLISTDEGSLDNAKLKTLFNIKRLSGGAVKKAEDKPSEKASSSRAFLLDSLYARQETLPVDLLA
jgi:hypothetical protein